MTRWTTALATTALLGVPAASWAQGQPSSPAGESAQSTAQGAPATGSPRAGGQHGSVQEHLREAKAALNGIPEATLSGTTKTRVAELKAQIGKLERSAAKDAGAAPTDTPGDRSRADDADESWATDVAAVERILAELLAPGDAAAGNEPVGTSGTTAAAPRPGGRPSRPEPLALDETTRARLQEVRKHVTEFAAAMNAGRSASRGVVPSHDDPAIAASAAAPPSRAATGGAATSTARATDTAAEPAAETASTSAVAGEQGGAAPSGPGQTGTPTSQPGETQTAPPAGESGASAPAPQVAPEVVKRHLTAARDVLSQVTQLPAAAQLTGEARTHVTQLISNFNELITTNSNWRAAYAKVQANLGTLLGEPRPDEPASPAAGTAGAVGTTGTVTIDPNIRAKLLEFQSHLREFEQAAGGAAAAAGAAISGSTPGGAATDAPASTSTPGAAAGTGASSGETSAAPAGAPAAAPPASAGADRPGAQGSPAASGASTPQEQKGRQASSDAAAPHRDALRHIDAIETILNGRTTGSSSSAPAAGGTAGTSGAAPGRPSGAGASTLDAAQIEAIRTHLNELRRALAQSGGK